MPQTLATHGIAAIKDSESTFKIVASSGTGLITPTSATELKGTILFSIPPPNPNNPTLSSYSVNFSSQTATVNSVKIYLGNAVAYTENNLFHTSSFTGTIGTTPAPLYQGQGIAIALEVTFENLGSSLRFTSVSVTC